MIKTFQIALPIFILLVSQIAISAANPIQEKLTDGPLCPICTALLTEAQQLLQQNATDQQILSFLENKLCSKLGPLEATCKTLVALEGPAILKDLAAKVDPKAICAKLNLCSSQTLIQPRSINVNDGPLCPICTALLTEAQQLLQQNATDQQILNFLENQLCSKLGSLEATCKTLVALEGPAILKDLAAKVDPKVICAKLKLCSASEIIIEPRSSSQGGQLCQLCSAVLTAAQSFLEQNKTEDEVIAFIDNALCNRLGALSAICKQYVDEYGKLILYELSQKIDPSIICSRLGLCTAQMPVPFSVSAEKKNLNLNSELCKLALTQAANELKSNAKETEVIKSVEAKLCQKLPNLTTLCKTALDLFGPKILNDLANGIAPENVCAFIGIKN